MTDHFLQRSKAKLAIAKLLGYLDRRIRRELQEMSEGELWGLGLQMNKRIRALASADSPDRIPSMGTRMRVWREYPLRIYLDEEGLRRYDERVRADPEKYLTPFDKLSNAELDDFRRWFQTTNPDEVGKLDTDGVFAMWKRERRVVLPVLPIRSGSLPTNANARRSPNNRKGSGPPGPATKADEAKASQAANAEAEGEVFRSFEDREIH